MTGPSATADIEGVLIRGRAGHTNAHRHTDRRQRAARRHSERENPMIWQQGYNPFGSMVVSTALAAAAGGGDARRASASCT